MKKKTRVNLLDKIISKPKGPICLSDLSPLANLEVIGNLKKKLIYDVKSIDTATKKDLTFIDNTKYIDQLSDTNAAACIISKKNFKKSLGNNLGNIIFLISDNPYLSYSIILSIFYPSEDLKNNKINQVEISPLSIVSKETSFKNNVYIGKKTSIGSYTSIGPNVSIGEGCIIGNNVSISNTYIGNNVRIQDGCVIGQDGFGYAFDGNNYIKVPQIGLVKIGNFVEIGANCAIDRGSLKHTEIKQGVKIDNLVHIAHNVEVKENTMIAGQTGIAGSSIIGSKVLIGGQVGVAGHLNVGDNVKIGAQAGVTRNIASHEEVSGTPAVKLTTYLKKAVYLNKMVEKKKSD